jgi:N-acetylated-alpha-linked acidic dipeptidase
MTELNGYKPYPNGPARNPSSVQRGSVQYLSLIAGDPTTPGYASKPGVPRQDPSGFNPTIPSLPISYADALPLLRALNGHGLNATDLGEHWSTGGLYFKDVKYNIGPAPGIVVNLVNEVDYVITPHWNVIGEIKGYIPDETVILGNHRDAWVAGGAADPNSGTAAFLEMARSFGKMLQIGWKPARTIILASWDGEEYALLGSTEWVEDHHAWLSTSALAYINVDVGTVTPHFEVSANPLLNDIVRAAASRVPDPNSLRDGKSNVSIADVWGGEISTLGSGSDYTAFQDYLGIPSVDMGFGGSKTKSPVYHYHSNYDSFHWMEKFGDPSFRYHVAMSKIWGLIALNLAETPIIPFNTTAYADGLANYLADIQSLLKKTKDEPEDTQSKEKSKDKHMDKINPKSKGKYRVKGHRHHHHHRHKGSRSHEPLKLVLRHRLHHLRSAIHHLHRKTKEFEQRAAALALQLEHIDKFPWWKRALLFLRARAVNQTYKRFDRCFLHAPGLDGRSLFKHVVFAPGKWTGYSGDRLPGLVESVREGDWANAIVSFLIALFFPSRNCY